MKRGRKEGEGEEEEGEGGERNEGWRGGRGEWEQEAVSLGTKPKYMLGPCSHGYRGEGW